MALTLVYSWHPLREQPGRIIVYTDSRTPPEATPPAGNKRATMEIGADAGAGASAGTSADSSVPGYYQVRVALLVNLYSKWREETSTEVQNALHTCLTTSVKECLSACPIDTDEQSLVSLVSFYTSPGDVVLGCKSLELALEDCDPECKDVLTEAPEWALASGAYQCAGAAWSGRVVICGANFICVAVKGLTEVTIHAYLGETPIEGETTAKLVTCVKSLCRVPKTSGAQTVLFRLEEFFLGNVLSPTGPRNLLKL